MRTGIIHDLPERDYHADPDSLSVSGAKVLLKAPALFRHQQQNPVHRDVFDFGTLAHALVLGAGLDSVYVTPLEEFRTNAAKAEKEAARAEGFAVVTPPEWEKASRMAEVLHAHPLAAKLLSDGRPEVSAFALDEPTGILRRARFDWLADGWIVDYKTTTDADPSAFASSVAKFDYHMQAAWYLDVARACGHDVDGFTFIAQSKESPYLVSVLELDWASEELGRRRNRRALDLYAACVADDHWPAYGDGLHTISVPRWAHHAEENAS